MDAVAAVVANCLHFINLNMIILFKEEKNMKEQPRMRKLTVNCNEYSQFD